MKYCTAHPPGKLVDMFEKVDISKRKSLSFQR